MNILIINASPKPKGCISKILDRIISGIDLKNLVIRFDVYRMNVSPCRGCLKCRPAVECILSHDGGHDFSAALKNTDIIIIGTPNYWGNMPGPLKMLFDRNVPAFEYIESGSVPLPVLKGKKAFLIISSGAKFPFNLLPSQGAGTYKNIKNILHSGGIKIIKTIQVADANRFFTNNKESKYLKQADKVSGKINALKLWNK